MSERWADEASRGEQHAPTSPQPTNESLASSMRVNGANSTSAGYESQRPNGYSPSPNPYSTDSRQLNQYEVSQLSQAKVSDSYNSTYTNNTYTNGSPSSSGGQYENGYPRNDYTENGYGQLNEESPELLRWRAESLLDEMMLGGADGSATSSDFSAQNNGHHHYGEGPAHGGQSSAPPLPSRPGTHQGDGYLEPPLSANFGTENGPPPANQPMRGQDTSAQGYGPIAESQSAPYPQTRTQSPRQEDAHSALSSSGDGRGNPPFPAYAQQTSALAHQSGGPPQPPDAQLYQPSSTRSYGEHDAHGYNEQGYNQNLPGNEYSPHQSAQPMQPPQAGLPLQSPQQAAPQPVPRGAPPSQRSPLDWSNENPFGQQTQGRSGEEERNWPTDPATYYAQQNAFRRELERKQWAISSGNSNDYLTSVPRYEEAQNRTASYANAVAQGYQAQDHPTQGHQTQGFQGSQGYPYNQENQQSAPWRTPTPQQNGYENPYSNYADSSHSGVNQPGQYAPAHQQTTQNQAMQNYASPNQAPPTYPSGLHTGQDNASYAPELGPLVYDRTSVEPHGTSFGHLPHQQSNLPFADSMAVGSHASARSNLLPRQTRASVDSLYEEMTVLQSQVDKALPIYGDSAERARNLLEKGRIILEQTPQRSAEVSYYVQQVRGIIQRGQQRIQWSNLYRSRLSRYLTGWLLLSIIMLLSSAAYGGPMAETVASWFPAIRTIILNHLSPLIVVVATGTLGSAAAALFNMWSYSRKEYGFFDRKYGLLGIILPIIGLTGGLLIYGLLTIAYALLGLVAGSSVWLQMLPAVLALAFGAMQEKIYGTSE
ncbi:MAG: hypothetical protein AAF702_50990 [Chloroflexota bacterium]